MGCNLIVKPVRENHGALVVGISFVVLVRMNQTSIITTIGDLTHFSFGIPIFSVQN